MGGKSHCGRTLHYKIKLLIIFKFLFYTHLVIILQHSHPLSQFSADWVDVVLCAVWLIENQKHNSKTLQSLRSLAIVLLCVCIFASHITAGKKQPLCHHASHSSRSCTMYYGQSITYLYVLDIFQSWWYYDLVCKSAIHSSCLRWHHYLPAHQC